MRINFDFIDLTVFLTVFDTGSFQRAGEVLSMSQSAITRRVQKLEEGLGVTLFERTTRSIQVTLAARLFYERAKAIVDNTQDAVKAISDDVSQFDYYRNEIITIATIQTATHDILPSVIRAFREQGYTARIQILDDFANGVVDAVAQGHADFGISFIGMDDAGVSFTPLFNDTFVVAMHRDNVLRYKDSIHWDDLATHSLAVPWKGSGNRMLIENGLSHTKHQLQWSYQVRHSSSLLSLVEANIAVAILPLSAIPQKDTSLIITRRLVQPSISRGIGIVRRTGHTFTASADACYQLFIQYFSDK